jgi:L-ascorbate metabolism protein UlaG (beta-lactamase superfamily)
MRGPERPRRSCPGRVLGPPGVAPRVRFLAHACIALEGERETLLTDPWLFGDVFNSAWTLCAPPALDSLDLGRVRHIWISHEHPDHLHFPSLRWIRDRVAGPVTVYHRRRSTAIREAVKRLGFDVVELAPHRETAIAADISGTLFQTGIDSALVIRLGDRIILNQNDCSLTRGEVDRLRRLFPRIDVWLFQFSLGGYYANPDDAEGLRAARDYHLRQVARYFEAFRPRIFIPFASFFSFAKEGNAFLNNWSVTPAQLVAALPALPTQVLWSGDAALWEGWETRNALNLARWEAALRSPKAPAPHAPVGDPELAAAGRALVEDVARRRLARHAPDETHLEIRETGRAVAIDCRRGRFELREQADPRRLAVVLPGDELLHFLRSPNGSSVQFGSCLHVVDRERWWRLRQFRDSLDRSLAHHFLWSARRRIAGLDQRLLGARLTRWSAPLRTRRRGLVESFRPAAAGGEATPPRSAPDTLGRGE